MTTELIPFEVDTQRIIQLLAKQIYQSPLALLRENTQNAFDAVRERLHRDPHFSPRIDITLEPHLVTIVDNGIGMTGDDLRRHYWTAGSSSKNNETARAAGVVGTFGIGAMANFGIADFLTVETESAISGERTICRADKSKLSLKEDCIERQVVDGRGDPGTTITAHIAPDSLIKVAQAHQYIAEFVSLVDIPVLVNGDLVSQRPVEQAVPRPAESWTYESVGETVGERLACDVTLALSNNADVWLKLTNLQWSGRPCPGRMVLRSGQSALRTFRSGFGLATASVNSIYQFGGVADLLVLEPTAGREALTVESLQLLQSMMVEIDAFTSTILSTRDECDVSTPFMNWVVGKQRYDLCGRLRMAINPGDRITLSNVSDRSRLSALNLYEGSDPGMITMHASEDSPLLVLARTNPRRACEENYLRQYARVERLSDAPVVTNRRAANKGSIAETAFAYRIESILESDYFLKCVVDLGTISHGLPTLVQEHAGNVLITMNPEASTIQLILSLYDREYEAFGGMVKDFVRTVVFPRVADRVPSSTRQGAEAFLKAIRRSRESFEYADNDLGELSKIWGDYDEGLITVEQAVERSKSAVRGSIQVVETATQARDVLPDVIQNEQLLQNVFPDKLGLEATPAITRLETSTSAKLLVIDDSEPALRGYRCFLALTDRVRSEVGEFFLQPHRTSIVWGGQKMLFVFTHHSGEFGLYYDVQTREPVESTAGGGPYQTSTIVLKDRIFVPIPDAVRASFVPKPGERKRLEVAAYILRTDSPGSEERGT